MVVVEFFVCIFAFFFFLRLLFLNGDFKGLLESEEVRRNKAVEKYGDEFGDRFREKSLPVAKRIDGKYWYQMGDEYVAGLDKPFQEMYEVLKECPTLMKQPMADRFMPVQYKLISMVKEGLMPLEYLVGDQYSVGHFNDYPRVQDVVPIRTDEKARGIDPFYYGHNKYIAETFQAQKELMMWVNRQFEKREDPGRMVACYTLVDSVSFRCLPAELVEPNVYTAFWAFYPSRPANYVLAKSFNEIRILCDRYKAKNDPPRYKTFGKF